MSEETPVVESVETPVENESVAVEEQASEEVSAPEVDNEDLFSKRFSALSKREKKLVEEQAKYKELEDKFSGMSEAKQAGVLKLLEYHGISLDDVIAEALGEDNTPEVDPVDKVRQEFEEYKQAQLDREAEEKRKLEEQNQNSINEAIDNHKQAITSHLSQNSDKYELINSQGEQDLVWEVTEAHFDEYGEVLSIEDASDKVEQYLENKVRELLKLKKFNPGGEQIQDKDLGKKEAPTLNSRMNTSSVPVKEKPLNREQSLKQAASLLKWK